MPIPNKDFEKFYNYIIYYKYPNIIIFKNFRDLKREKLKLGPERKFKFENI